MKRTTNQNRQQQGSLPATPRKLTQTVIAWIQKRPWLLVIAVALFAHAGALGAIIYMDDTKLLLPFEEGNIGQLEWKPDRFRWLTFVTFWLNFQISGLSSPAFHCGNIILHAVVAVLVFFVTRDWLEVDSAVNLENPSTEARLEQLLSPTNIAVAAACLFAAHPLGSEITHYIRARDTLLMTLFGLACAWMLSRFRGSNTITLAAGLLFAIAAMYSKPTGPVWVAGLTVWTAICFWKRSQWIGFLRNRTFWLFSSVGVLVLLATIRVQLVSGIALGLSKTMNFLSSPALERTGLTQTRQSALVARQLVAPTDLVSDHQGFYSMHWTDPAVIASIIGLLLSVFVAIVLWRRSRRWQVWALGTLVASHLLHGIYVSGEIYCEYRTYPSLVCFSMLAAWAAAEVIRRTKLPPVVYGLLFVILVLACTFGTRSRSSAWRSVESISADVLQTYPMHIRAHHHSIMAASGSGQHELVLPTYKRMNKAMADLQKFNRRSPYGRLYNWDLAVRHAIISTGITARSTTKIHGLQAGLDQLEKLERNLKSQQTHLQGILLKTMTIARAWVLSEGGAYDELEQFLSSKRPFEPATFRREVIEITAVAKKAGHVFSWDESLVEAHRPDDD